MSIRIAPMALAYAESFHQCLDEVAREKRYLAQVQAPPLERVRDFVRQSLESDAAQFVALDGERVVGWADIFAAWPQATSHRGNLGIGVLPAYRGQGIGRQLLDACIGKAWSKGMTRVDLETRADNERAIVLYEKLGFRREGIVRNGMRFDGVYYDCVLMGLLKD
jgi:RimJ/RimL family protein N-acetyltransferase